ncbi:MAG: SDR family oxidoreductase [Betaproteobacteria bacterium]|nr:SDR family oxidoreductase [Betaproteobacteria bacterium]
MRFKDRVAFISGAGASSPGWSNGKAVSVLLAREGAKIFALDRSPEHLAETLEAISAAGGECVAHTADVTREAEVKAAVDRCTARFGRIDVLFNNVGLQAIGGPEEIEEEVWDRLMNANVKSIYLTCRHVLPVMVKQRRGVVINNSSMAATSFLYPSIAYSSSKGAVDAFTRNLAVQYAGKGVRVVAVRPGLMATPRITSRMKAKFGDGYEEALNQRNKVVPMGAMGDAWDVANAVAFLASDDARYITATELVVDGGLSASALGHPWDDTERNL